jgi:hypothetical protein
MREGLKMKSFVFRHWTGPKKSLLPSKIVGSIHGRTDITRDAKKKERGV